MPALYQNGEFHIMQGSRLVRIPSDRNRAVELFEPGANLNDMLNNYNPGMAYKNGENGVTLDRAKAFTHLSKAAETGFMPAMVQKGPAAALQIRKAVRCICWSGTGAARSRRPTRSSIGTSGATAARTSRLATKTRPEIPRHYKAARDLFKREFEAAQKDKAGTNTFIDRMRDVVNVDKATKRR